MNLALTFDTSGSGRCLYSELIDLSTVGQLQIKRASQIEFHNRRQVWEVRSLKGKVLFHHRSRAVCLAWEHQHL
jgi:hypothetical protein